MCSIFSALCLCVNLDVIREKVTPPLTATTYDYISTFCLLLAYLMKMRFILGTRNCISTQNKLLKKRGHSRRSAASSIYYRLYYTISRAL